MLRLSVCYIFIVCCYSNLLVLECIQEQESMDVREYCLGDNFTLQCCVNSSATTTVWMGSSLDCDNEIILLHSDFNRSQASDAKKCVSNNLKASALIEQIENEIVSSKLNIEILSTFNTSLPMMTITCQMDNGILAEVVATYNIVVTSCMNDSEITMGVTTVSSGNGNTATITIVGVVLALVTGISMIGFITLVIIIKKRKKSKVKRRNVPTISIQRNSLRQINIGVLTEETANETQAEPYNQLCFDRSFSITNHEYNKAGSMHGQLAVNNYSQLELQNMYGSTQNEEVLDLDSLLVKLRTKMDSKLWYQFGMELGVPVDILETLIGYPDDECMVELLDHWLRNHPDKPTWDEIEQVVHKFGEARNVSHYDIPVQLAIPVKGIYSDDK